MSVKTSFGQVYFHHDVVPRSSDSRIEGVDQGIRGPSFPSFPFHDDGVAVDSGEGR